MNNDTETTPTAPTPEAPVEETQTESEPIEAAPEAPAPIVATPNEVTATEGSIVVEAATITDPETLLAHLVDLTRAGRQAFGPSYAGLFIETIQTTP